MLGFCHAVGAGFAWGAAVNRYAPRPIRDHNPLVARDLRSLPLSFRCLGIYSVHVLYLHVPSLEHDWCQPEFVNDSSMYVDVSIPESGHLCRGAMQ